ASTTTPTPSSSSKPVIGIGDTLDLDGMDAGEKVSVTVMSFVDPAKPASPVFAPDAGDRFVAILFKLVNTGTVDYEDSPASGSTVIDSTGQRYDASLEATTAGTAMSSDLTLAPGASAIGFITFEVPNG